MKDTILLVVTFHMSYGTVDHQINAAAENTYDQSCKSADQRTNVPRQTRIAIQRSQNSTRRRQNKHRHENAFRLEFVVALPRVQTKDGV